MDLVLISTIVAVVLFLVIAGFQVGLASGRPWGEAAYGGMNRQISPQLQKVSAGATVVWLLAAVLVIQCARESSLLFVSESVVRIVCWVIAGYLALAVAMNAISRSKLERNIWTPVSAVALIAVTIVLLKTG